MKKQRILPGCLALLVMAGCSAAGGDTRDADIKAVKDTEAQWNQDFAAKDLEKLVAHYTDDGALMSPGMPAAKGKDAVRSALKMLIDDPALSLKFAADRVEAAKSGDMVYTQGSYQLTVTDPTTKKPINDKGSYVTVYKKQADGSWKAVSDIATSEAAPAPPK